MTGFVPLSKITDRKLQGLTWVEPRQVLINLRWVETNIPEGIDERVRRLRINQLKEWREARAAALFAYGMGKSVIEKQTFVAKSEDRDYDFVMRWSDDTVDYFYPVQLKELPPEDLNPEVSLDDVLTKLAKYSGATDLSVAVHINRRTKFEHRPWGNGVKPNVRELWYFGCCSRDQSTWFLYGSVLQPRPHYYEFAYPIGSPNVT